MGDFNRGVYTTGPGVVLGRASEPHRRRPDQGLLQGQSLNGMNGLVVQKFPGISETPREQQELDKQKEKKRKRKRNYGSSSWRPARIKKGAQICEAHFDRRRQPRPIAKANRKKGQGTCKRWKETMQVTEIPNQTRWEKLNHPPTNPGQMRTDRDESGRETGREIRREIASAQARRGESARAPRLFPSPCFSCGGEFFSYVVVYIFPTSFLYFPTF